MQTFISHSSKDGDVAKRLCEYLEKKGKRCFLAPRDIRQGKEYAEEIIRGIEQSDAMVLLMSKDANQSPHVLREVERAVSKSVPVFVFKLEEVELSKSMEYFLMTHQWLSVQNRNDFAVVWEAVCGLKKEERVSVNEPEKSAKKSAVWIAVPILILILFACLLAWQMKAGGGKKDVPPGYELGDTVTLGVYNGEPVEWRVLRLSEDGNTAVLVAKEILTFKAFDAAESGTYNVNGDADYWLSGSAADTDMELQCLVRGNNDWSVSNIRTWLNADTEVVPYADTPPMASAMSEKKNGYHNEPGFLYGFSETELAAILPTDVTTCGNALTEEIKVTEDLVYLLSVEELSWFEEAGISKLAVPTQEALEQDQSNWYEVEFSAFGTKEYYWWLRDAAEGTASIGYMVNTGYTQEEIVTANVGLEGFGIRPAITVNLQADYFRE